MGLISDPSDSYQFYCKPKLATLLKLLKVDRVYVRAQGDELQDENGDTVLDLLGGYGSTLLGHSHPHLIGVMKSALAAYMPIHAQASIRSYSSKLAAKINELFKKQYQNESHFVVHLANTGTEAVEAAIKHQLMAFDARASRAAFRGEISEKVSPVLFAIQNSFHGKSAASVAATWNENFRSMYPTSPVPVVFLNPEKIDEARRVLSLSFNGNFCNAIGILFEPIQCEGGIRVLPKEFRDLLIEYQKKGIPLIADEIQTGTFRTGEFLASGSFGITPDLFLLGKSLGGSLSKISALCIRSDLYEEDFGVVHTSTFSEDDLSSKVALEALHLLESETIAVKSKAKEFETWIKEESKRLDAFRPFLKEVRCYGFLVGIEFDFEHEPQIIPLFLKTVFHAGFASYLLMSVLLNQHQIRVGVTLSQPNTIRLEPSLFVTREKVARFFQALGQTLKLIVSGELMKVTQHLWRDNLSERALATISPRYEATPASERSKYRTIGFTSHLIDDRHLILLDPMFKKLSREERARFLRKFGEVAKPCNYHDQVIEGKNGEKVRLCSIGSFRTTPFYEETLKNGDAAGNDAVYEMVDFAKRLGSDLVGLGQYTSIVTRSGTTLKDTGVALTSGNALTAGFAFQALERLMREENRDWKNLHIGVVGARGNIGAAIRDVLLDQGCSLTLVVRSEDQVGSLKNEIKQDRVTITHDLSLLKNCDAVLVATNTAQTILFPEHFKENAIVIDASVPAVVDARVSEERKDVRCYHGGLARLPLNQTLNTDWMPLPNGQIYACLAETLVLALSGHQGSYSLGKIDKNKVYDILNRAHQVGIELGQLMPLQTR